MSKKFMGKDYKECQLEGLYGVEGMPLDARPEAPEAWHWKLIIRVPDFAREKDLEEAVAKAKAKGKTEPVESVKLDEGSCVRMLHVGPCAEEVGSLVKMRALTAGKGMKQAGPNHEIYLSDQRRVAPEKLRTILRIPVAAAEVAGQKAACEPSQHRRLRNQGGRGAFGSSSLPFHNSHKGTVIIPTHPRTRTTAAICVSCSSTPKPLNM
jgi:GyrI-like small molecule binding domain